jgi:hypothetical protein
MVSYDYLVGCFLMAHKAGFNDYLFDPKMGKVIEWMAKISTPPKKRGSWMASFSNAYALEMASHPCAATSAELLPGGRG